MPDAPMPYQMIDFFSGQGAIRRSCQQACIGTAALDLDFGKHLHKRSQRQDPFDLASDAGFVFLGFCPGFPERGRSHTLHWPSGWQSGLC